jgi:hypothetical protein
MHRVFIDGTEIVNTDVSIEMYDVTVRDYVKAFGAPTGFFTPAPREYQYAVIIGGIRREIERPVKDGETYYLTTITAH